MTSQLLTSLHVILIMICQNKNMLSFLWQVFAKCCQRREGVKCLRMLQQGYRCLKQFERQIRSLETELLAAGGYKRCRGSAPFTVRQILRLFFQNKTF